MTKKLFWSDPYQVELETTVRQVAGNDITLAETIFYAESGGQESDHGTIGEKRVLKARKLDEEREIIYTLEPEHGLSVGQPVFIRIDWPRRYRLMRLHFAAELVLELVYRELNPVEKIGAHIAEDKARIDFRWSQNISTIFPKIQGAAMDLIRKDQKIISAFSDEANEQRYWELDGFCRVPCGGTHLRSTAEVGELELRRKNIGKEKERIEIYAQKG